MTHLPLKPTYPLESLEPYFDAATMDLHVNKHHQTYADKLNTALSDHPELRDKTLQEILSSPSTKDQSLITNMAGGVVNHDFFWTILSPEIDQPIPDIFKPLIPQFTEAATKLFGSGWTWLVKNQSKFEIINLPNQDSPYSLGLIPLLALDLWEHSYYLKFQNRRAEYIEAFWHLVNWSQVNKNYESL